MTRFPLLPVQPDKFTLTFLVFVMVITAAILVGRFMSTTEEKSADAANDPPAVAASPAAPASDTATPPAQPARYLVKTVDGQATFIDAASRAGLNESATFRVAQALRNIIDFRRDWKENNRVSFVFDTKRDAVNNGEQHTAMPAAVRVVTDAGEHDIFLYRTLTGKAFYYTKNGDRARGGGFLRYPLKFRRISSSFSQRRFDPVLKHWQPHDGVDLAAPTGTPIHATANGVVTFAGAQTGYGNVIEIRNRPPYSTLFAHLSRFAKGIRIGTRVKRNEVIGYVGATGWATGPHLHYEVRVGDVPKNPLTVSLPPAEPLQGRELARFASRSEKLEDLM